MANVSTQRQHQVSRTKSWIQSWIVEVIHFDIFAPCQAKAQENPKPRPICSLNSDLVHLSDQRVDLVLPVTQVTTLNEMNGIRCLAWHGTELVYRGGFADLEGIVGVWFQA